MEDKRRYERYELRLPARIVPVEETDKERGEGLDLMTSDVCAGGAFFYTSEPLPEGTQVRIDLVLPLEKLKKLVEEYDHAFIKVTGTVLRTEPRGMAICFNKGYRIRPARGRPGLSH